jgi:hypothetical protein
MHIFKAISLISAAALASLAMATPTFVDAEAAVIPRQSEALTVQNVTLSLEVEFYACAIELSKSRLVLWSL